MVRQSTVRVFILAALFSVAYIGCGGSQDAVQEDELVTDTGVQEEAPAEETPAQDTTTPAEQAPVQEQQAAPQQEQTTPQEGPSKEQMQSELDAMKTENMQLKDENSALQQSNRDLTTKVSDLEAANAALASSPRKSEPVKPIRRTVSAPGTSSAQEISAYENAVEMTKNRNYRGAIDQLQTLLNNGIKDDYADNCHYWLGESNFHLKAYADAIKHFQQVQNYKFSEKADDAQLMIARSYELLGDRAKARAEYQKLVDQFPTSEYVKRARAKL